MITSPHTRSTVDPTQGLIEYVQDVKPYHTKILDVLIEYVYTENISVTASEKHTWTGANSSPGITLRNNVTTEVRPLPNTISLPINLVAYDAIVGGSGYVNGTYTNVPLLGGTGTNATADVVVTGGIVTSVSIFTPGSGYTIGDLLTINNVNLGGSGSGFVLTVQASDLHVSSQIGDVLDLEISLFLYDSIATTLTDIRPVGYGFDPYSTDVGSGFGTISNPEGLSITAIGTGNATFVGSISSTVLTVSSVETGTITAGQEIQGVGIASNTTVVNQLTGVTGGVGTYTVSMSQVVGSESMVGVSSASTFNVDGFDLDRFDV